VRVPRLLRNLFLAASSGALLFVLWLGIVWPPPSWYRSHWPARTAFMAMRDRQAHATHDTTSRRYRPVPLDSISDWLERAATAGEDDAFFQHHGVDWHALRQAMGYPRETFSWSSPRDRGDLRRALRTALARRDKLRGASTITQQLAKNLYLSPSRNPLRKVKEAVIAYRLEWALPKERILALYLNVAEFGPNLWGVEAASQRYFGRSAAALSMDQAAMLVATLPHPLSSNPVLKPARTRWRQQLILRRLRGENVEVPVEGSDAPEVLTADSSRPADKVPVAAPTDSAPPPVPADTVKPETKPPA
jgi:monofunctional biosynthetic peptidoglycan transglycosylase